MFSDLLGTLHVNVRTMAEIEHLQTALMLARAVAFAHGAPADVSITGIVFRRFTPASGWIVSLPLAGATSALVAQFLRVAHAVMARKSTRAGRSS